jgi:hypothetical protein
MLAVALLGFLGYRAEGEFTLEGDKLVLEATRSSGFSVRPNPRMRLSMKKVWKKGSEVRVDCGWNQLRISFRDEAEMEAFVSASDRLLRSGGHDGA